MFYIVEFMVFSALQISVFRMLPNRLKDWIVCYPIPAFLLNMCGSFMILDFAGQTHGAGGINLCASVTFGLYLWLYRTVYGVIKTQSVVSFWGIKIRYTTCKRTKDIIREQKAKDYKGSAQDKEDQDYADWLRNAPKI
jgi:hypothetical protein